jgi:hypothetical protein
MIYAEHVAPRKGVQPCIRVFSNVDSHAELDKCRCYVRAPVQAFVAAVKVTDREHLLLFGNPRDVALKTIPADRIYETSVDRIAWERDRPEVMKNHPVPFLPDSE